MKRFLHAGTRRIRRRVSIWRPRLLHGVALSLGSLVGCEKPFAVEYGPGPATWSYSLDGQVVEVLDDETMAVVPGMEVAFDTYTTVTDEEGLWDLDAYLTEPCEDNCSLDVADPLGAYEPETVAIQPELEDLADETALALHDILIEVEPVD